ncbi:biosynthetic peptidoglycan transglycosylase [Pseudomonas sp. PLB05]|uniref:biosynthetic peptidoglycan transglycosylase n=1 Tax=Pseudomonas sp. PLB05 TaxID=2899078 RepID=UPI001E53F5C8|nr:transglycosylase domain-containing protein [Pseudomonas sp. PLB05]
MWQTAFQRASYRVFTLPVYLGIAIVRIGGYSPILKDFSKCILAVERSRARRVDGISDALIHTLILAEDHRNKLHFGVDPLAIVRALKVRVFEGKRQGASTIEQQLVRTITGRYQKSPRRKVREQILAVMVSSVFTKEDLARCYLMVAYYGVGLVGCIGLKKLRARKFEFSDEVIVAHLKYPRGLVYEGAAATKHSYRVEHIRYLLRDGSRCQQSK